MRDYKLTFLWMSEHIMKATKVGGLGLGAIDRHRNWKELDAVG